MKADDMYYSNHVIATVVEFRNSRLLLLEKVLDSDFDMSATVAFAAFPTRYPSTFTDLTLHSRHDHALHPQSHVPPPYIAVHSEAPIEMSDTIPHQTQLFSTRLKSAQINRAKSRQQIHNKRSINDTANADTDVTPITSTETANTLRKRPRA